MDCQVNDCGDNSLINFLNSLTTIQLDSTDVKDAKLLNGSLPNGDPSLISNGESFVGGYRILKDFKTLSVCEQADLGSAGNSDQSLSFGSESNDSAGECCISSSSDQTMMPSAVGVKQSRTVRESSQSPAFFGFSSSNSSSPPLSQTSGASSASSLSEAISTMSNGTHQSPTTTAQSSTNFYFNLLSHNSKSSTCLKNNDSSAAFFNTNPLDNMFGSILNGNTRSDTMGDSLASVLDDPTFRSTLAQNRFGSTNLSTSNSLMPTSFSQDSLPQFMQNSFTGFATLASTSTDQVGLLSTTDNGRKFPFFNAGPTAPPNTTPLSSNSIISTPSFLTTNSNFMLDSSIEQRICNNMMSSNMMSNSTMTTPNRFDSHIRSIANEINNTATLYLNSIIMRKENLLKQLEHVRNTYTVLLSQKGGKVNFPKITFTRQDSTLFKLFTSFGFLNSPAFGPFCQVSGEGLTVAIEGEPTCFSIQTRNCFNEETLIGGENIDIEIQPFECSGNVHGKNFMHPILPHVQKNILDNNNGKYNVTYMIPRGSHLRSVKISIIINGLPLSNSPFLANVKKERIRECWKRLALFGEEGQEVGKFCRPWGVAIVRLPIQKDPNHKPIGGDANSSIPVSSKHFYNWNSGSPNKKDYLLVVADRSNNRIQLLKLSVIENNNRINQNDSNHFVHSNPTTEISVLHVFGQGPGTRPGQFDRPAGIAINSNFGQIVVADKDNHRIQVFDLSGNFLFKFGEKGIRPGQFSYPWDVAICPQSSQILVSDTRNRRIQLFTHFGQLLWQCAQPLDSPRGVAFLSPDRFIVSDFNKHRLLIVDRNDSTLQVGPPSVRDDMINSKYIGFGEGQAWGEFLRPQGLVAAISKNHFTGATKYVQVLCADSRNNRIAIWNSMNQNFEYIQEETKHDQPGTSFDRPSGIALAENILVVVDFGNNRLQIYQKSHT